MKDHLFLLIIILVSFVIGSATLTRGHDWGDDFASYIMQAQSILDGSTTEFVEHNTFTIFESSFQIGPVAYPWGYPLILTLPLFLRGVHPLPLKVPGLFFFVGFLVFLYFLMKSRLSQIENLLFVSLFAFNPILLKFLNQIISDIPFLCIVFLGLLLISNMEEHAHGIRMSIILGAVLYFAFSIRTTGIILLANFLAYQTLRFYRWPEQRRYIFVNSIFTAISFSLFWVISSSVFPDGQSSYIEQLKGLTPKIFRENIQIYFLLFRSFFGSSPAWIYIYYIFIAFFLIGTWFQRASDNDFLIFFGLYLLALLFWPERQGIRFIFPLLPLFVYFVFQGCRVVIDILPEVPSRLGRSAFHIFWLILIGMFLYKSGVEAYTNLKRDRRMPGPFDSYSMAVYKYIKEETSPDSVIVFYKPRAMRLFTNHDAVLIMECERLSLGDYAVISKYGEKYEIPSDDIDECGVPVKSVLENRTFVIYKILK